MNISDNHRLTRQEREGEMKYYIEVKIWDMFEKKYNWHKVRPTHGNPCAYNTKEEAEAMLKMCYPEQTQEEVKITTA